MKTKFKADVNLTKQIKFLEVGDIIVCDNKLLEVGLKTWSNGARKGSSPNLRLISRDTIVKKIDFKKLEQKIIDVVLHGSDKPIKEKEVKFKDMLKHLEQ